MKHAKLDEAGFSMPEMLIAAVLVIGVATFSIISTNQKLQTPNDLAVSQSATLTTWNDYKDSGYAAASGISFKYPPDWKVNISGVKAIGNTNNPTATINERTIFLPTSLAPKEEWNTCAAMVAADACGAAPGDKTVTSNESVINGLAVYTATMQNDSGIYHVTVVRGNNATPNGIPFVELTTTSSNPAALSTYTGIISSATFSN